MTDVNSRARVASSISIGKSARLSIKALALSSVMRPFRTASPVTLTTSYNHNAGTIALSVRLERRLSKVSVNGVASSLKHHAIVTVLSRTNRLTDGLRQSNH